LRFRILVPVFFFSASVWLWFVASAFRGGVGRYELIGPNFFPKILLVGIMGAAAAEVLREFLTFSDDRSIDDKRPRFYPIDLASALGITIAYVVGLHVIGFLLATLVFQALMLIAVFRLRRWRLVLGAPVVLTTLFYVIFIELMNVPLPRGQGVFRELSRMLY